MRMRLLLLSVAGILCAWGFLYGSSTTARTGASDVSLGEAAFSPSSLPRAGASILTVTVATGAEVPSVGADNSTPITAVVEVTENSNFSRVSYQVTPSRVMKIPLEGGGKTSVGTLTFDSTDAEAGHVMSQVKLMRLENHPSGVGMADPTSKDVTLSVMVPPPTPTPTPAEPPRS